MYGKQKRDGVEKIKKTKSLSRQTCRALCPVGECGLPEQKYFNTYFMFYRGKIERNTNIIIIISSPTTTTTTWASKYKRNKKKLINWANGMPLKKLNDQRNEKIKKQRTYDFFFWLRPNVQQVKIFALVVFMFILFSLP